MRINCSFCGYDQKSEDGFKRKLVCGIKGTICATCVRLAYSVCLSHLTPDQIKEIDNDLQIEDIAISEASEALAKRINSGEIKIKIRDEK